MLPKRRAVDHSLTAEGTIPLQHCSRPLIAISANSFWNIANFRSGLIDALFAAGYQVTVIAPDVSDDWCLHRGVRCIDLPIDRSGLNPMRDAILLVRYAFMMNRLRPAALFTFTAKPNIYGALAARIAGIPSFPNVSGLGTGFLSNGILAALMALLYRVAFAGSRQVFFQNSDDRDLFLAKGLVRRDQARLIPGSGIDLDGFPPAKPEPSGPPRFLFVGRMLGDKGVREFVEAASLLKASRPDWTFQLLGPIDHGNRTAIDRHQIDRWVAAGVVDYLGETTDVRPYIEQATAVVLPSYREGLPRVLLEGAAMARPLIASDVPGCREVIDDGVNGFLCGVRDADSLADAMRRLGELTAAGRESMGQAGRLLVARRFDASIVHAAYLEAVRHHSSAQGVQ